MSAQPLVDAVNRATVAAHGEPVLLPDGAELRGIFSLHGQTAGGVGSMVGVLGRPAAQDNPELYLLEADAAALPERAALSVRGVSYIVASKDPDGEGFVRCGLMPAAAAPADSMERWR